MKNFHAQIKRLRRNAAAKRLGENNRLLITIAYSKSFYHSKADVLGLIEYVFGRTTMWVVETPAMAAGARRETRHGAEGDEEDDGGDGVHDSDERV